MKRGEYGPLQREYSGIASRYDTRWNQYVQASIHETLQRLDLSRGDRVLDIGCGTGALLAALSRRRAHLRLTGVDLSPEMLKIARQRLGPAVDLRQAPAESLPLADTAFDLVVTTSVFHFIRQPIKALCEMRRVLRPGGQVVVSDWCDDYLTCRVCDLFLRVFNRAHYRTYGSHECHNLLSKAGFENIAIDRYKINWLWGMMTATADRVN